MSEESRRHCEDCAMRYEQARDRTSATQRKVDELRVLLTQYEALLESDSQRASDFYDAWREAAKEIA